MSIDESSKDKLTILDKIIDIIVESNPVSIREYVDKLREQNIGISNDDLAKKIVTRKSFKNGLVGAATGIGGVITLPLTVPADLVTSWKIQAAMAFSIAYVYGHNPHTTDLKTDLYLILAGDSAKEALKRIGIETSKVLTKKGIEKYITREVMRHIWKYVGRKIITKAGEKSLTSFVKMVPLVGAPIGFIFNWISAKTVGNFAIDYYKG